MTSKFLQALAKLKPSSTVEVRAQREKSGATHRGAVAFEADVYRRKRNVAVVKFSRSRITEH